MSWASNADSEDMHSQGSNKGNAETMEIIPSCYIRGMEKYDTKN